MPPSESDLRIGKFRFAATGLVVDDRPEIEEWASPLQFALWCQRASPWWIGDLLVQGEGRFGEEFAQICEGEVSHDMLQRYEGVARKVPIRNRHPDLSWSAHAAVARLPVDSQRAWLDRAFAEGWSSTDLQKKVSEFLRRERG